MTQLALQTISNSPIPCRLKPVAQEGRHRWALLVARPAPNRCRQALYHLSPELRLQNSFVHAMDLCASTAVGKHAQGVDLPVPHV